jgi:hypothetical protein
MEPVAADPFENSMLIQVSISALGNNRKVSTAKIETHKFTCPACKITAEQKQQMISDGLDEAERRERIADLKKKCQTCEGTGKIEADKALLRASKKLFDSPEYNAIGKYDGETRKWIEDHSLPSHFAPGMYQVWTERVRNVTDYIAERLAGRKPLVDEFMAKYDFYVEDTQKRLGPELFNPKDYKTHADACASFYMSYRIIEISTPGSLKAMDRDLYEQEKTKIISWAADAKAKWEADLTDSMKKLVDHALDRLAGGKGGKPQMFQHTMVSNIEAFLGTFDDLNAMAKNPELANLKQTMQKAIDGVDAQELRDSKRTRAEVVATFTEIQAKLDEMIVNRPARAVSLE